MADTFQEAPIPLIDIYKVGDSVTLLTLPSGLYAWQNKLGVQITEKTDDNYRGRVVSVETVGDTPPEGAGYHKGEEVSFKQSHIQQGYAPKE